MYYSTTIAGKSNYEESRTGLRAAHLLLEAYLYQTRNATKRGEESSDIRDEKRMCSRTQCSLDLGNRWVERGSSAFLAAQKFTARTFS